ncbi:hypothetical protein GOODEAATRI_014311 [Goodea atripinnis]|uniref:Chemokine interleukin-8-like domain-containing protein n=1 Tax=Goodea atripinnis TaxID=208336 RepID=A0ABV0P588_9TELE
MVKGPVWSNSFSKHFRPQQNSTGFKMMFHNRQPQNEGFRIRNCCTRYSNKEVVLEHIKGYQEQIILEFCRINAIIFYTTSNQRVCANPEDEWVKKTLISLRQKKIKL